MWATAAIPVVGSLGTVALVISGGRRQMLIGLVLMIATLGAMALQTGAASTTRRRQLRASRENYRRELDRVRNDLVAVDSTNHGLNIVVGTAVHEPEFTTYDDDPRADAVCVAARDRFLQTYATLPDARHLLDLATTRSIRADRAHARAIILEAAESLPPDVLGIRIHTDDHAAWQWIALLPHHDAAGTHRLLVVDGHPAPNVQPPTTVVEVVPATTAAYEPLRCGPAEAAVRARQLAAAPLRTASASAAWTVTLGMGEEGPVHLDLREAADGGVGPHGLLVGATGSGKSELLRQVLSELIATHPAEELHLALIDFKGGAAFAMFEGLPHVAAYVTNLAESWATRRLREALEGELVRRQSSLAAAGASSVREHPLPRLLIVIDEFTELLATDPAMSELFSRVGRLGRSLGIHLLLSTQRLEEGRLHGLEAHLSYRIALRTFSATESRLAIGSPLAAELPRRPGSGLLAASGALQPFQAPDPATKVPSAPRVEVVSLCTSATEDLTVLEARVRSAAGAPAPHLWLPPLNAPPVLADLPVGGRMHATIGIVDRPRDQRIDALNLDLTGAGGHVAVVGGPRTGKSTALRTLAAALRRSTPDVRLLALDLTGGLAGALPAERIATAQTPERVDRLLRHLRRRCETGASPPIVLLIDSWSAIRDNYRWMDSLHQIAERGLAADIHLAVATHRWSDLRPAVRDLFGSRIELRLGDPLESEVNRHLAAGVPRKPGHGLIAPGFAIQLALDSGV
ncbi:hypothetical protein Back2_19420 [Nocardioides baekrokdamisoli]|uniref:FtsK domain-containing protein n=2 Tax=Nocardioides baekrokdamisoli TaxID=1804624 RepID=A0A3G9INN7_9ACTN|nr:hypothetical protein Back2_19420 [Nocardioides baekrokdamisoli]